tara:strand:- start:122 stop:817 length:696 start_codon:yes stop_codon:yes gene_type:complete
MAINIDTVYQTVQALANKEQRGYITPQEFNLFANQAQQDIFEQYLYDLNAFQRQAPSMLALGDSVNHIKTKLGNFLTTQNVIGGITLPNTIYRGAIYLGAGGTRRELKEVSPDTVTDLNASTFHKKGFTDAVYFMDGPNAIQVWDGTSQITSGITIEVVSGSPSMCHWGYVVVNEEAVYDPGNSTNFVLHASERPDLIVKILKLAGISMEDQQLYSAGSAEDGLNTQQENK